MTFVAGKESVQRRSCLVTVHNKPMPRYPLESAAVYQDLSPDRTVNTDLPPLPVT